jgi:hypothetical protein
LVFVLVAEYVCGMNMTKQEDLLQALSPLLNQLNDFLTDRPALRRDLASAANAFSAWLSDSSTASVTQPVMEAKPVAPSEPPPPVVRIPKDFSIPIRSTLDSSSDEPRPVVQNRYVEDVQGASQRELQQLPLVSSRCRLKAEVCEYLADKSKFETAGDSSFRFNLIAQAKALPNCYLWMITGYEVAPALWLQQADAYRAAASAAELMLKWLQQPERTQAEHAEAVLHLTAEAQSTLRSATGTIDFIQEYDQVALFNMLRDETRVREIFVRRHLKLDDPAPAAGGANVVKKCQDYGIIFGGITASAAPAAAAAAPKTAQSKLQKEFKNLIHKLKKLGETPNEPTDEWPRIMELVDHVVLEHGLPPSNVELREALLPLMAQIPQDISSKGMARVLDEIDDFLAHEEENRNRKASGKRQTLSPDVEIVRQLLTGREMVFIGGNTRPEHQNNIMDAFELKAMNWVDTRDHAPTDEFESHVARPDVAVVIVATRWSSHSYQNVREFCVKHGKPYVKLPAGYHPNQLAHAILSQVGQKLQTGEVS